MRCERSVQYQPGAHGVIRVRIREYADENQNALNDDIEPLLTEQFSPLIHTFVYPEEQYQVMYRIEIVATRECLTPSCGRTAAQNCVRITYRIVTEYTGLDRVDADFTDVNVFVHNTDGGVWMLDKVTTQHANGEGSQSTLTTSEWPYCELESRSDRPRAPYRRARPELQVSYFMRNIFPVTTPSCDEARIRLHVSSEHPWGNLVQTLTNAGINSGLRMLVGRALSLPTPPLFSGPWAATTVAQSGCEWLSGSFVCGGAPIPADRTTCAGIVGASGLEELWTQCYQDLTGIPERGRVIIPSEEDMESCMQEQCEGIVADYLRRFPPSRTVDECCPYLFQIMRDAFPGWFGPHSPPGNPETATFVIGATPRVRRGEPRFVDPPIREIPGGPQG